MTSQEISADNLFKTNEKRLILHEIKIYDEKWHKVEIIDNDSFSILLPDGKKHRVYEISDKE